MDYARDHGRKALSFEEALLDKKQVKDDSRQELFNCLKRFLWYKIRSLLSGATTTYSASLIFPVRRRVLFGAGVKSLSA